MERRKLAIDIDGILTREDKVKDWWKTLPIEAARLYAECEPNEENIELVRSLYEANNEISLYTSRDRAFKDITRVWMQKMGVPYHEIMFNKMHYDILFDDRATNDRRALLRLLKK